jgi:hypothetical protein
LGILGIGVALAAGTTLLSNKLIEIKSIKVSERNVNVFQNLTTKEIFEIEITKEDCLKGLKLNQPNAKQIGSYCGQNIYAMPELQDNQYYIYDGAVASGTARIMIKLPNQQPIIKNFKDL